MISNVKVPTSSLQLDLNLNTPALMGKDELNLVDVPFALLSPRLPTNKKTSTTLKTISVRRSYRCSTGELKVGSVVVTGSDAYGLPMSGDVDLWMGILQLFKTRKFESDTLKFTRYELLNLLGWPTTKHYYDRLRAGLNRLKSVNIMFDKCWWNADLKEYTSTAFSLIDNYELVSEAYGSITRSFIKLNEVIFYSCKTGFIKNINLTFYLSLTRSISKSLFRVLDKQAHNKTTYQIGLRKLAHDRLGMPTSYFLSKIKQLLAPALTELCVRGFLAKWDYELDNIIFTFPEKTKNQGFNRSEAIANQLTQELNDPGSFYFYLKLAAAIPEPVLYRLVGEVKELSQSTHIKNKGRYFTTMVLNEAKKIGIRLAPDAVDSIVI